MIANLPPNTLPRKMPTARAIFNHWKSHLLALGKFDDEFDRGLCFACGVYYGYPTHRAHILARVEGGLDTVENLHLLCITCHKDSEYISGDTYDTWFKCRSVMDANYSRLVRHGVSVTDLAEILKGSPDNEVVRRVSLIIKSYERSNSAS